MFCGGDCCWSLIKICPFGVSPPLEPDPDRGEAADGGAVAGAAVTADEDSVDADSVFCTGTV